MDGNKELELSLGLACGVTTSPSNDKSGNSADDKTDADERTSKILNDFRNFLNAGASQSLQRTDPVKPPENFFNQIQQIPSGDDDSINEIEVSENKRKSSFDDSKTHKKQETESHNSDLHDKEKKNSHISITTDEGSTGDNEDVAESEAEGSTSRMVSHHNDDGSASSSQAHKEASSFPIQTMNTSSVPYSMTIKESASTNALSTSIYPLSMHNIPPTNGSHPLPHAVSNKIAPLTFTHSSIQTPDKGHSWGIARPPAVHAPYSGRPTPTSASMLMTNPTPSEATQTDVRPQQQRRSPPILISEEGSPSLSEGNAAHTAARPNSFPSEYPAIKPGIAAEVKFGGSGSFPNLPWVSTTGSGPNGKTISGVTYKFNASQIKIVCACHGIHLSPEEFVRHATDEQPSGVTTTGLTSLQSSNPTTSAQS